jgi:hypothetical protein
MVDTGGDIDADDVARAIGVQVGRVVTAAPVYALNPDTDSFSDMLTVRVPPDRAATMRDLVAVGTTVYVNGRDCRILPLTLTRSSAPRMRIVESQTDRVAEAIRHIGGGEGGTVLEYGKFKLSGKSAVVLAVKYGCAALVAIATLYLIAKVHGWIPNPVAAARANVSMADGLPKDN